MPQIERTIELRVHLSSRLPSAAVGEWYPESNRIVPLEAPQTSLRVDEVNVHRTSLPSAGQ